MTCNIGRVERVLRALVGAGLISLVFVGPHSAWGWIGLVPLATAVLGWCPPYALLGISTCRNGTKNGGA
ncbi:MAG: DUF2892 domain-containing protein [Proteobacteria bacterium]|nr:DUF2892 domain-containing protein [Pseudomonadota bacterium]MBS0268168.1 DUF2892 domain-containing protein [Pseudomonadota bacterium]